jgi:hypothetical protein
MWGTINLMIRYLGFHNFLQTTNHEQYELVDYANINSDLRVEILSFKTAC